MSVVSKWTGVPLTRMDENEMTRLLDMETVLGNQVIGQEEVVIKPLGKLLQGLPGLSGATITGDGNIALIIDVPGLLRAYAEHR